ncbi:extracellular catalytic domain type 1 short-chain-length polyhydroxyalkanoate depolymerase [Piscinibacter terrae]|nr:PHB depolymerase family esterase [Albitalea terrae]
MKWFRQWWTRLVRRLRRVRIPSEFVEGSFSNEAGARPYMLFIPTGDRATPRPLLVMLHGCKQNPLDFSRGTRMNEWGEKLGWYVLYPGQVATANRHGCWNWFSDVDQRRGEGEPSIIADLTREVLRTQAIDRRRVFVAGLSAGGAMSAIMATTYPELYAAVGIHSGLPYAAASDLVTALRAMKLGLPDEGSASEVFVPTIVFHGDRDHVVHPRNGEEAITRSGSTPGFEVETGQVDRGRRYTRRIHIDESGACDAEHWVVHGAGHAWSGGDRAGSFTDPQGPDASREMLRFFEEHPRA